MNNNFNSNSVELFVNTNASNSALDQERLIQQMAITETYSESQTVSPRALVTPGMLGRHLVPENLLKSGVPFLARPAKESFYATGFLITNSLLVMGADRILNRQARSLDAISRGFKADSKSAPFNLDRFDTAADGTPIFKPGTGSIQQVFGHYFEFGNDEEDQLILPLDPTRTLRSWTQEGNNEELLMAWKRLEAIFNNELTPEELDLPWTNYRAQYARELHERCQGNPENAAKLLKRATPELINANDPSRFEQVNYLTLAGLRATWRLAPYPANQSTLIQHEGQRAPAMLAHKSYLQDVYTVAKKAKANPEDYLMVTTIAYVTSALATDSSENNTNPVVVQTPMLSYTLPYESSSKSAVGYAIGVQVLRQSKGFRCPGTSNNVPSKYQLSYVKKNQKRADLARIKANALRERFALNQEAVTKPTTSTRTSAEYLHEQSTVVSHSQAFESVPSINKSVSQTPQEKKKVKVKVKVKTNKVEISDLDMVSTIYTGQIYQQQRGEEISMDALNMGARLVIDYPAVANRERVLKGHKKYMDIYKALKGENKTAFESVYKLVRTICTHWVQFRNLNELHTIEDLISKAENVLNDDIAARSDTWAAHIAKSRKLRSSNELKYCTNAIHLFYLLSLEQAESVETVEEEVVDNQTEFTSEAEPQQLIEANTSESAHTAVSNGDFDDSVGLPDGIDSGRKSFNSSTLGRRTNNRKGRR